MIFDFWDEIDLHKINRYFKVFFVIVITSFAIAGVIGG